MITALLAIDGIVFLIALAVMSIVFILLSAVDDPCPQGSGIVLAIVIILTALFTNAGQIIKERPIMVVIFVVAYILIGCFYSVFIRWPLYLNGVRRRLIARKASFLVNNKLPTDIVISPDNKELFQRWIEVVYEVGSGNGLYLGCDGKLIPPQYSDNKARLSTWAILWPWNVFWVLIRKPIIWIFEELLNLQILNRICQAMSNWMFRDFNK